MATKAKTKNEAEFFNDIYELIIPKYREAQDVIVSMLDFDLNQPIRILDLGCGTGALSARTLATFPNAEVIGIDSSDTMIAWCWTKLRAYKERFTALKGDLTSPDWSKGLKDFNAVISAFTFHLLPYQVQEQVLSESFGLLKNNGRFVSFEFFDATDPWIHIVFRQIEIGLVQNVLKNGRISKEDIDRLETHSTKTSAQKYVCPLEIKIEWLRAAGFALVEVPWRFYNFAVISGKKLP